MAKKTLKLNVLLATTDHLASVFKKGLEDYVKFFKTSQGAFKGERKTYEAKANTMDLPAERSHKFVITTVGEKLDWFTDNSKEYINALFSQEKTNSMGVAKAKLVIDDIVFGEFTSMELLRLKSLLEYSTLKDMYENIPVRNDDELWSLSTDENYSSRKTVYESVLRKGVTKTTHKESYILPDPNISKIDGAKYQPMLASKDTVIELGDYSHQRFSGEFSHLERALILQRRTRLLTAVIEALKVANEVESLPSEMTAEKIFTYLHTGK